MRSGKLSISKMSLRMGGRIGDTASNNRYQMPDSAGNAKSGAGSFAHSSRGAGALGTLDKTKAN